MQQYGLLLENFKDNGEYVNDCIFTMMHHIGGDLGQVNTLFQPIILKTYSRIWETGHKLCDVSDFIYPQDFALIRVEYYRYYTIWLHSSDGNFGLFDRGGMKPYRIMDSIRSQNQNIIFSFISI